TRFDCDWSSECALPIWRIQLEWVFEAQLLPDLAHRRHDLLAQQADAGAGVLVANRPVIAPDAVNARPGLFQDAAQFGNDGLRRRSEERRGGKGFEGWAV